MGRWAKLHLPRFTSNSSGTHNSSKWPTADDRTYLSLSKKSPMASLVNPPSALAISLATDGSSAMINALPIANVSTFTRRQGMDATSNSFGKLAQTFSEVKNRVKKGHVRRFNSCLSCWMIRPFQVRLDALRLAEAQHGQGQRTG